METPALADTSTSQLPPLQLREHFRRGGEKIRRTRRAEVCNYIYASYIIILKEEEAISLRVGGNEKDSREE